MRINIKEFIFAIAFAAFNMNVVFAQIPNAPPPPPPPGGPPLPPVPIDSNLFILAFAALILGFYIISKQKQTAFK